MLARSAENPDTTSRPSGKMRLACITVTFNPDLHVLQSQQQALPRESLRILVDNASQDELLGKLQVFARERDITLIRNGENRGLAAALNQGAQYAIEQRCSTVLLLDQDTEPTSSAVHLLSNTFDKMQREDPRIDAVGPRLQDPDTFTEHGFHRIKGWQWTRLYPAPDSSPVECDNLNGSGTMMRTSRFIALGGLDESLFIDHIDTEWSFRIRARGGRLFGIPAALFHHRMGLGAQRLWLLGWRTWPKRSAQRQYYLVRNTVWLLRRAEAHVVWRVWATVRLLVAASIATAIGPNRFEQLNEMRKGLFAGFGRCPPRCGISLKKKQRSSY